MSDGFGPRYTCPRATGVLAAPTGLYHVCAPEEWRVCNSLCRASKAATAAVEPRPLDDGSSVRQLLAWLGGLLGYPRPM